MKDAPLKISKQTPGFSKENSHLLREEVPEKLAATQRQRKCASVAWSLLLMPGEVSGWNLFDRGKAAEGVLDCMYAEPETHVVGLWLCPCFPFQP
jgi:hypothetical protein